MRVSGDPISGFRYEGVRLTYDHLSMPLAGSHQLENAACALAMLELATARGIRIAETAVRTGLRAVQWPGRLEAVERDPLLVLDGAHNPAAARVLRDYLVRFRVGHPDARLLLVVSIMRDKDRYGLLHVLAPVADEVVLTQANLPRAADLHDLRDAMPAGTPVFEQAAAADALALARAHARPQDLICVTGSLMLVGEISALLRGCGLSPLRG